MIWHSQNPRNCVLHILLITFLFEITSSATIESPDNHDYSKKFLLISGILSSTFPNCTVFFFWEAKKFSISPDLILRSSNNNKFVWSGGDGSKDISTVFSNLSAMQDIRQRREDCSVAITFIAGELNGLPVSETATHLVKSIANVVPSDRGYFVFILNSNQEGDNFLLQSHISQGIRHKFVLVGGGEPLVFKTSCPFCDHGNPKILTSKLSTLTKQRLLPELFKNFYGKVMKVSSAAEARWLTEIRPMGHNKWNGVRGVVVIATREIAKRLNFTCEYFPSMGGGGTGFRFPNGSWIGTVADVLYGNADFGQIGGLIKLRYETVDFTFPLTYEWLTFTTGQPTFFFSWKAIYRPLSFGSWTLVVVSFIVIIISFIGLNWLSNFGECRGIVNTTTDSIIPMVGIFLQFSLKAMIEQGNNFLSLRDTKTVLISPWFRSLCSFWLLFSVIVTTAYKSKLVSFLAFPIIIEPPNTFEELVDSDYSIVLQRTGAAYQIFKTSKNPTYMQIMKQMEVEPLDVTCFKKVFDSRAACISWERIVGYVSQKNLTDIHGHVPLIKSGVTANFLVAGIMMRKRTVFRREFDFYIRSAMDSGLMNKFESLDKQFILEERKEWERSTNKTRISYATSIHQPLTIAHLMGSFYLLLAGALTSALVFCLELVYKNLVLSWQVMWRRNSKILSEESGE